MRQVGGYTYISITLTKHISHNISLTSAKCQEIK